MIHAKTSIGIRIKIKDFLLCLTEKNFYSFYSGIIESFIEEILNNNYDDIIRKNLHKYMLHDITNFYNINKKINGYEQVNQILSNNVFEDAFIIIPIKDILNQNAWNNERKRCCCCVENLNDVNVVKEKMDESGMTNYTIVFTLLVENHK